MPKDPIELARLCSEAIGKEVTARDIWGWYTHGIAGEGFLRFNTEEVGEILRVILKESTTDARTT
jgi:hypothetical protein